MDGRPTFFGDELSAAGFRLAGLDVETEVSADAFQRALVESPFVIVTAERATALPLGLVTGAVRRARPPVAVVADARRAAEPESPARRVKRVLGVADGR